MNIALMYDSRDDADVMTGGVEISALRDALNGREDEMRSASKAGRLRCPNRTCHRRVTVAHRPTGGHTFTHVGKGPGTCAPRRSVNSDYVRPSQRDTSFDLPASTRVQLMYERAHGWGDVRQSLMGQRELEVAKRTNDGVLNGAGESDAAREHQRAGLLAEGLNTRHEDLSADPDEVAAVLAAQRQLMKATWRGLRYESACLYCYATGPCDCPGDRVEFPTSK